MRSPSDERPPTPRYLGGTLVVRPPAPLDPLDAAPVQTWPDPAGRVCAAAYRRSDGFLVEWLGLAAFEFNAAGGDVVVTPAPDAQAAEVRDIYERFVLPLVWQGRGGEALHASAVQWDAGVVLFCGPSGMGKSTLAYALAHRGHPVLTDDGVLLDPSGPHMAAHVVRGGIRLRSPSAHFFGLSSPAPGRRTELTAAHDAVAAGAPVRALFVLRRQEGVDTLARARRAGAGEALALVLEHAHCVDPTSTAGRRRTIENYMALLAQAPLWVLSYPSGFEHLEACIVAVERALTG